MPGTLRPAAVLAACAVLLVAACSEQPVAPPLDVDIALPRLEFALVDDTASYRGPLLDSLTIVVPDSVDESGSFDLWAYGDVLDYALVEILADIQLDNRSLSAAELLPTPNPIVYFRSDGEMVFRAFSLSFFALPQAGGQQLQAASSEQTGDSIVILDTDGALHGMRVYWGMYEEEELDYNAITDGEPPECALLIGEICYPPPAFTTPNISDTPVAGTIRLRAFRGPAEPDSFSISLSADTTELRPWIRFFAPFSPAPFIEPGSLPEQAVLTVEVLLGDQPLADQEVAIRAEFLDNVGGHAHLSSRVNIADGHIAVLPSSSIAGHAKPVLGMFVQGADTTTAVADTSDSEGEISLSFVAGFVSGEVEIIASTTYGAALIEDTLRVTVRVPSLENLDDNGAITSNALMIGATEHHAGGDNRYATAAFEARVAEMVQALQTGSYYLQLNDASLPWGGAFTVVPPQITEGTRVEQPGDSSGHRTHTHGIDQDVGWCYALAPGFDEANDEVTGTNCGGSGTIPVDPVRLEDYGFAVLREGNHYHIRLEVP